MTQHFSASHCQLKTFFSGWMDGWQVIAAKLQLIKGVAERLKQCRDPAWSHEVWELKLEKNSDLITDRQKLKYL